MTTRRLGAGLVLCGLLGLGYWLWPASSSDTAAGESLAAASAETAFEDQARAALAEALDAGVGLVEGVVVDEAGQPVPGATVSISLEATSPENLACKVCGESMLNCSSPTTVRELTAALAKGTFFAKPLAITTTGPDGRYRVDDVPKVDLRVIARKGDLAGLDASGEGTITVRPSRERAVSLYAEPHVALAGVTGWAVVSELLEAQRVISGPDGVVRVRAWGVEEAVILVDDPRFVAVTTSTGDSDGAPISFLLTHPRTLLVHLRSGGKPVDGEVVVDLHGGPKPIHVTRGELKLEGLPRTQLELVGQAPGLSTPTARVDLEDLVTEATLELRASTRLLVSVTDEDGQPLEKVSGSLDSQDSASSASASSEGGALLVFGPLAEGEYTLTLNAEHRRELREVIDLHPGELQLERHLSKLSVLSGTVVDGRGPVAKANVRLRVPGSTPLTVESGEDGSFSFDSAPVADAMLSAQSDAIGRADVRASVPGKVVLRLEPRASLQVDVQEASGQPLKDVVFSLRPRDGQDEGASNEVTVEGAFGTGVMKGLGAGRWELSVTGDGLRTVTRDVALVEGRVTREQVTLDSGASVEGQLLDADGAPVRGGRLFSPGSGSTTSDEAGHFRLTGLEPGKVTISVIGDDGGEDHELVAPARDVVFRQPRRQFVTGRVVDEAGSPVTSFQANDETVNDPGGAFKVPIQRERLIITSRKYDALVKQVTPGEVGTLVLHEPPWVEGDVVDAEGKPVAGARVRASAMTSEAFTGADGRFHAQIADLAAEDGAASEELRTIIATRGGMMGKAVFVKGVPAHLVLGRGTRVVGRVLAGGRPAAAVDVTIDSLGSADGSRSLVTDAEGKFEVMLWAGAWNFTAAGLRVSRAVDVAGDRVDVELGGQLGRCSLEVNARYSIDSVQLDPLGEKGGSPDLEKRAGTLSFEVVRSPHVLLTDLPCEEFVVTASGTNSASIQLRLEAHSTWNGEGASPVVDPKTFQAEDADVVTDQVSRP